jgi:hypothetical protein
MGVSIPKHEVLDSSPQDEGLGPSPGSQLKVQEQVPEFQGEQ